MTDKLNLIETIAKELRFSKFSSYMQMSGADATLALPGQFTVFVPSDEAFAKIPDVEMNALLNEQPDRNALKALLSYHIVPGKIMAASIGSESVRAAITGEEIKFADYRGLKVNGVGVLRRNIEATNGVVHSLESVLTRPESKGETAGVSDLAERQPDQPAENGDGPASTPLIADESAEAAAVYLDTSRPIF